jgi:hypothetical protein
MYMYVNSIYLYIVYICIYMHAYVYMSIYVYADVYICMHMYTYI